MPLQQAQLITPLLLCTYLSHHREVLLHSVNVTVLGAILSIGAAPRPSNLGVNDYGGGLKTLNLCPPTPNCISTAEEANDPRHYVPAWCAALPWVPALRPCPPHCRPVQLTCLAALPAPCCAACALPCSRCHVLLDGYVACSQNSQTLIGLCRTYNPAEGRGKKNPATQEQAMQELYEVVSHPMPT